MEDEEYKGEEIEVEEYEKEEAKRQMEEEKKKREEEEEGKKKGLTLIKFVLSTKSHPEC